MSGVREAALLLDEILAPIAADLADPAVEDVAINAPQEAWARGPDGWTRRDVPAFDGETLEAIAILMGALRRQDVGADKPFCGGELHTGHRFQVVVPPAVPPGTVSLTFRRPSDAVAPLSDVPRRYGTARWNKWQARGASRRRDSAALLQLYDSGDVVGFLRAIVRTRRTPLLAGPTGAGKTFMSKTMLAAAPRERRVLTIEDALEMVVRQPNAVRLLFAGGGVTPAACLHAALRMRPDLIPLQELREPAAAWVYLNEVATGHPGSPTTIHGETAPQAARRLFALLKGSPEGAGIGDAVLFGMMGAAIDLIVPIGTEGATRQIGEVWFADEAARRGETIADLLRMA
ncbi:Protein VirB11 (plasmid) [Rhodovastum atsumiense]|uniref:Type IV secretion system protein VirB11 n=1 Tax=Rhodovastum atsumiense TaxID=504468 RepID=A0A5M6IMW2_9PROT|nr:ATPase, T2SS/T4P/T4SS family [Rhodovastum atsumiense]KAA5609600.1 type IV secretion system protein VirB11 [Rhodovastum atsumiense]CAH2606366.1 Protein VirB11 [Rhodovastum atsumiense]